MFLGIDIGTSGVKAVAQDGTGPIRAQSSAPLRAAHPEALWSEQAPRDWWAATEAAVLAIPIELRARARAIGLAGQMHGATLLDDGDRPLRPAILWNDGRSFAECDELEEREPGTRRITGNLAMPGFTAPKLLWVRRHEPHVFERIRSVLLPKDYVRLCMTGDKASDMSDSAGTLWLDGAARAWSERMLAACSLSRDHMPMLFEGNAVTGTLRADIAERWDMPRVPVVAGGGDNAAAAAGMGVVSEGDALLSLGTSGVIFVATGAFRPHPARAVHAFCHCLPGMWHQMAVHLSAAACIDWGAALIGVADADRFLALARHAGVAAGPELFLPYLSGERTPHNDPHVRGAFLGLDNDSDRGRLAAAVLEGVAFALADGLSALREAGTTIEALTVGGGGARSRHWGEVLAAALGVRLVYVAGGDVGPALGAAKLARMAVTGAAAAEACARPTVTHVIEPDGALADRLAPKRDRFRAAYAAVQPF
jgi:xylulokinase